MKRAAAVLAAIMMLAVPFLAGDVSADDVVKERTMTVRNVYSCEFVSLGTLPSYEKGSNYYFVKGSENHIEFMRYIHLESSVNLALLEDDFSVIQRDDTVVAYMFSTEFYDDGYASIIEFYNFEGTILVGYLQLKYTLDVGMDTVQHFFVKGSTAVIRWNTVPSNLTVYFGGENISKKAELVDGAYQVSVYIENNGAYSLWFANDSTSALTGTVSYSVGGFETSGSMTIAVIAAAVAALGIAMLILVFRGPKWSEEPGTGTLLGRILGGLCR